MAAPSTPIPKMKMKNESNAKLIMEEIIIAFRGVRLSPMALRTAALTL